MSNYITALDIMLDAPPADIEKILYPDYWDTDTPQYIESILFYLTNYPSTVTLETDTGIFASFEIGADIKLDQDKIGCLVNYAPASVAISADKKTAVIEFNKIEEVTLQDILY